MRQLATGLLRVLALAIGHENLQQQQCPVSPDLARGHAADLRRVRLVETASSWLSH